MSFPSSPSNGQLATVNNILYSFSSDNNAWSRISNTSFNILGNISAGGVRSTSSPTAPAFPVAGDMWYNTNTDTLYRYTYTGAASFWLDISSPTIATLSNNTALSLANVTVGNTNSVSTTTGALVVAGGAGIAGNLWANTVNTIGNTTVGGNLTVAGALTTGGGWTINGSTSFQNLTVTGSLTATQLIATGSTGVIGQVLQTTGTGIQWGTLSSTFTGGSIIAPLTIASSAPSTDTTTGALIVQGGAGIAGNVFMGTSGTGDIGSNVVVAANTRSISTNTGALVVIGGVGVAGNVNVGGNVVVIGTMVGTASRAQYADLAENYVGDTNYESGIVVVFGGTEEVTLTTTTHDTRVAGVVTTKPAYLMNAFGGNVSVALTGRVPCYVQGPVTKGTLLVTSETSGVATALNEELYKPGCVLGKSLEEIADATIKTIEVAVGRF